MITIEGKSVFGGVSIGKLMFYKRNEKVIRRTHVDDVVQQKKSLKKLFFVNRISVLLLKIKYGLFIN